MKPSDGLQHIQNKTLLFNEIENSALYLQHRQRVGNRSATELDCLGFGLVFTNRRVDFLTREVSTIRGERSIRGTQNYATPLW